MPLCDSGRRRIGTRSSSVRSCVSIIVPHPRCPAWQISLVRLLHCRFDSDIRVIGVTGLSAAQSGFRTRLVHQWQFLDARVFLSGLVSEERRAFQEMAQEFPGGDIPVEQFPFDGLVDALDASHSDLVIWLVPGEPPAELRESKERAVWWLSSNTAALPGFWELIEQVPILQSELLEGQQGDLKHRVVGRVFAKTDHWSISRTVCRLRALEESLLIARVGEFCRLRRVVSNAAPADDRLPGKSGLPSVFQFVQGLARLYGRYALSLVTRRFHRKQWQLIIGPGDVAPGDLPSLPRLAPGNGDFWADPFPIRRDGKSVIYFEHWDDAAAKGHIAASEVRADGTLDAPVKVVDRDFHLSYPFLFEHGGQLYMIPESADANRIEAYRCVDFPYGWEPHAVLMEGLRAFDATVFEYGGKWWMYAAIQHNGNTVCDELHLFCAPGPFEEWKSHKANPVSLDIRCARPGGALFIRDGEIFRPAQDCSEEYGYALAVQRVLHLDEERYEEETAWRLVPDWAPDLRGLHTFNQAGGITACDVKVRCRRH